MDPEAGPPGKIQAGRPAGQKNDFNPTVNGRKRQGQGQVRGLAQLLSAAWVPNA